MTEVRDIEALFRCLRFDVTRKDCWHRKLSWRAERSNAKINDAETGLAPTKATNRFHMAITNPLVPYDPKDQTSRATILILQNAGVADTVALAVAEANALLVKDGDQPHGLWTFETEDAEDGGTMTVHNAFADERSGSWNVTLSPGKDFWLLMDPARSYGDDYIRWRDGTLKVLQTDRAPPLLPASVP